MRRALGITLLLVTSPLLLAQAQENGTPLSQSAALTLSLGGTLAPVAAGLFWWRLDQAGLRTRWDANGWRSTYYHLPSRTAPALLIASGLVVGPSLGHFYSGRIGGVGLRLGVALGTSLLSGVMLLTGVSVRDDWIVSGDLIKGDEASVERASAVLGVGVAAIAASAVYDIVTAPRAARNHNQARSPSRVRVLPDYSAERRAVGLRARITF